MRLPSFATLVASLVLAVPAHAQHSHGSGHSSSSSRSSSGSAHVRGYTTRSGKTVQPYTRNAPGEGRSKASAPRASTSTHRPRVSAPHTNSPRSPTVSHPRATPPTTPRARDSHGRFKRSETAKDQFLRQTGHPHGWPGHVVDHRVPLACGGADAPSNMQWQTTEEAKAKDKVERRGCARPR
jgi:5-methylcytosine-specific restriction endonuclease McrA